MVRYKTWLHYFVYKNGKSSEYSNMDALFRILKLSVNLLYKYLSTTFCVSFLCCRKWNGQFSGINRGREINYCFSVSLLFTSTSSWNSEEWKTTGSGTILCTLHVYLYEILTLLLVGKSKLIQKGRDIFRIKLKSVVKTKEAIISASFQGQKEKQVI